MVQSRLPADRLAQIVARFEYLEARLNAGAAPAEIAELAREYGDLKPVVATITAWRAALDHLGAAEAMQDDPEMRTLAEEEAARLRAAIPALEDDLRLA
ncbi:MAG: PCRF domain-containing protein, partial [Gemmobacter sp.]